MNAISIVEKFNSRIGAAAHAVHNEKSDAEKQERISPPREELGPEEIQKALKELNRLSGSFNEKVQFDFNEKTNRIIIKIINKDTDEVVSEIPSKYSLRLLEHIQENMGIFVDESR